MKVYYNTRTKYYYIYVSNNYYFTSILKNPLKNIWSSFYIILTDNITNGFKYIGNLTYKNPNYDIFLDKCLELINKSDINSEIYYSNYLQIFYDKYVISNCVKKIIRKYRNYKLVKYFISRFSLLLQKYYTNIAIKYYPKYGIYYKKSEIEWNSIRKILSKV
jgi:hypothetical protein